MFCTLCIKHKMKNKFATEGTANISKKSAVKEHVKCKDHTDAEKLETARIQIESLQNQIFLSDANVRHIIAVMRVVESETPNISDESITYTNEISGREFLIVIAKTIEDEIWKELSDVVGFGIMIDESTDITITKHLDIYVSYVTKQGIFKTRFLCLLPLTESFSSDGASVMLGKNEGVAAKLSQKFQLNPIKMYITEICCKLVQFP
ncbi:hypothetical protein RhiirA5_438965 [Rhizophagus irregularis]|uniref:C17orf113 probable zinc finger domain-containing protein n=1 Tax=Rhizophagus irregularis TaxID=588596 RepID=A0A2N0NIH3_9GLOM|nr:hypothetical protein RhiirA5_438965 [Rhizophagus irregularis]